MNDNQVSQKLLNKLAVEIYNNTLLESKVEELQAKINELEANKEEKDGE